jgi:cytochrome c553
VTRLAAAMLAAFCACASAAEPPGRVPKEPSVGRDKARMCATCHGPLGVSNAPDAPHLAGQPRIYIEQQLKNFRSGKRSHEVMNVIAKPLTDADIEDFAQWYSSIALEAKEPR